MPDKPKQGVVTLHSGADYELDGESCWVTVTRRASQHPHSGEKMSVYIHCDAEGFIRIGLYKYMEETEPPVAEIVN